MYAQQKGIVFNVSREEMKAFLGICLIMGYNRLPNLRDYWSTDRDLHVDAIAQWRRSDFSLGGAVRYASSFEAVYIRKHVIDLHFSDFNYHFYLFMTDKTMRNGLQIQRASSLSEI